MTDYPNPYRNNPKLGETPMRAFPMRNIKDASPVPEDVRKQEEFMRRANKKRYSRGKKSASGANAPEGAGCEGEPEQKPTIYYAVKSPTIRGVFTKPKAVDNIMQGMAGWSNYTKTTDIVQAYSVAYDMNYHDAMADLETRTGSLVAFVDGSFECGEGENDPYVCGAAVVFHLPNGTKHSISYADYLRKYKNDRNMIAEVQAVLSACEWAVVAGFKRIAIFHDCINVAKWASGDFKANSKAAKMYVKKLHEIADGLLDVNFVKVAAHSDCRYNNEADFLAKKAIADFKTKQKVNHLRDKLYEKVENENRELKNIQAELDVAKRELSKAKTQKADAESGLEHLVAVSEEIENYIKKNKIIATELSSVDASDVVEAERTCDDCSKE